jgi:hypothetical protein
MSAEQQYHEVSRITESITPFLGGYLVKQIENFDNGSISESELQSHLTFIESKVKGALEELFKVKFPKAKQRANLSVLREAFRQYLKAVEEVRKALTKGIDRSKQVAKRLTKAGSLSSKYARLVFNERYKSASG